MKQIYDAIILGGGAAGIFAGLTAKAANPNVRVLLLERSAVLLSKVKISGGGRCNVTHACYDPKQLISNYPRGHKELLGPFTRFQPRDTIEWFNTRGVELKTEADGRMFPVTDSSDTIIECLLREAKKVNLEIRLRQRFNQIAKVDDHFQLTSGEGHELACRYLALATGSHPEGHALAKSFGHTIVAPVPSLFTFNIPTSSLHDLAGISVPEVTLKFLDLKFEQTGPLLITHWGFSGPAALKLSAWAARELHQHHYNLPLSVDWIPHFKKEKAMQDLVKARRDYPHQTVHNKNLFQLPKNLWRRLAAEIPEDKKFSEMSNDSLHKLCGKLKADLYQIDGKTTHKEEFVTCGGVALPEVNFKTMQSRLCPGLFFAGEILDIDAVTGGFNFQNAWTTGWLTGQAIDSLLRASANV
jgi:predicted Rossmann fold flavoprotein